MDTLGVSGHASGNGSSRAGLWSTGRNEDIPTTTLPEGCGRNAYQIRNQNSWWLMRTFRKLLAILNPKTRPDRLSDGFGSS